MLTINLITNFLFFRFENVIVVKIYFFWPSILTFLFQVAHPNPLLTSLSILADSNEAGERRDVWEGIVRNFVCLTSFFQFEFVVLAIKNLS